MTDEFIVVCDTREKKPYTFSRIETVSEAMKTGDYSVKGYEDVFAVERKSLPDFLKSITWDRDRFKREINRGNELLAFVVIVECYYGDITSWNYDRDVHPNSVTATVNKWEEYNNVKFVWGGDRERSEKETLEQLQTWYKAYNKIQK